MNKHYRKITFVLLSLLSLSVLAEEKKETITYDDQVYNFGHIGIDFKLFHTFKYVNRTDQTVTITDIDVSCDCSEVNYPSDVIAPGDTAYFNLIFSTKDYYGPTTKSFTIFTTDPSYPSIKYFYQSIVGQWYDGLKPEPLSIFFLPGKKEFKVTLTNRFFDEIKLIKADQYDDIFTVEILEDEADKNETLELLVKPAENLSKGTLNSVLTLSIDNGKDKPAIFSIPIKIVRY